MPSVHYHLVERLTAANVASAATTVIKQGQGFLGQIVINGGTMGNITVYDNTEASGTIIATITGADLKTGMVFPYGCEFTVGLTVVTAGNTNITICYV